jgi:hypothetical protein
MAEDREELHKLREQAHQAGIEGNSKMTEEELRAALQAKQQGASPEGAKQAGKNTD